MSVDRIAIFWPGDYRPLANELALDNVEQATLQMERALKALGRETYRIEGFITKPIESIHKLGAVRDPMVGIFAHWVYGQHTSAGAIVTDNPLLLSSNFSGKWPGLVGLLNTAGCLESHGRHASRLWTEAEDWTKDENFMDGLDSWCRDGFVTYSTDHVHTPEDSLSIAANTVYSEMKARRPLAMMLGDTSMGMINGYFGPQRCARVGITEQKVDQAWIVDYGKNIADSRIDDAVKFVHDKGVTFHYQGDFGPDATREQLRDYFAVKDICEEFGASCVGWQYQLGMFRQRPPSDFAEGLFNSKCRPESDGSTFVCSTEADQGNLLPMEMMKRLLKVKGLHEAVMFHDIRWAGTYEGRTFWVLLNSGSCGAYAFNHDPDTLKGVHSHRQPVQYFPIPGGSFSGESLPGQITWARAWMNQEELCMDIGRGEALQLPPALRDEMWNGTTREWPFMAADIGLSKQSLMMTYMSNHIAVAYGDIFEEMVSLSKSLGYRVRVLAD